MVPCLVDWVLCIRAAVLAAPKPIFDRLSVSSAGAVLFCLVERERFSRLLFVEVYAILYLALLEVSGQPSRQRAASFAL